MHKISFRDNILPLKDKLFRLALRITFDSSEAEDIVQDTLIKVWDKRDEWQQIESIESYCMTITRNLAIDRSQKMEARNMELTPEAQEMPDTLTPEKLFEQDEQLRLIHQAINSLPEKQRTIVQLRDIEGNFQKLTGSAIRLEVAVQDDSQAEKVPYMPSEKAAILIGGNEEVKTLVQDLGLDLK